MAMIFSCICPAFAATKTYSYSDTIKISDKASDKENENLLITVKNSKNDNYSLIDTLKTDDNGKYSYSFKLPSKKNDVWPQDGTYTVEVDGDTVQKFTIKKSSGGSSGGGSGGSNYGGGTNSGNGIVVPGTSLSNNGVIEVILNPNQYEKYGITSANVSTSGSKLSANTFTAAVSINGVATSLFTGYDPVLIKVPYSTTSSNLNNLVVYDAAGAVVPRSIYKDGYMYVNTNSIAGTFTIAEAAQAAFEDISNATHNWAMTAVNSLNARGIIRGVGNNIFEPNRSVTRAEFTKMIISMFNVYDPKASAKFTDVNGADWFNSYVGTAQALGVTNGYEDGSFRPNDTISREEMSTMLYRAAEVLSVKIEAQTAASDFADDWNIQGYAKIPVYKMRAAGILNGVGNNEFDPKSDCSRAQAAVAINNMFGVSMAR